MLGVFDIIGPVMIGPSSSHTAGAVRLGRMVLAVLGAEPVKAEIYLHGSFAETGKGHGTDLALIAGLLGMKTDDENIVYAKEIAAERGLEVKIMGADLGPVHPNTVKIVVRDKLGRVKTVVGSSIGGGNILITQINSFNVNLTGELYTICAIYQDRLGIIAKVSEFLAKNDINIAGMNVSRAGRTGRALMIVETDGIIPPQIAQQIAAMQEIDISFLLEPVVD